MQNVLYVVSEMRIWLLHERAFRLTASERKRFCIQSQYDANETFRNLLHWAGTVLQVSDTRCKMGAEPHAWFNSLF
jgi:hypothetical protein